MLLQINHPYGAITSRRCYSYVGRVSGAQKLSVGIGCELTGVVMHEMFHALGRWHEHSRPDRDLYIRISYENIRSGQFAGSVS